MADLKTELKLSVWPSPQDYNEAIQNLVANTTDAQLKKGSVHTTALGLPRSVSGAFASVYRVKSAQSDVAVRCFLRDISDQETRYKLISDYVQNDSLPYTVSFDFMSQGIRVGSAWYPALKMDWVEGTNLDLYLEKVLHSDELQKLPSMFKRMCDDLREAGIAHGDLQHGNIIVCGDELRLVDYDGMYVPSMQGMQANELGHRNYQHPLRTAEEFGPHLDNFSAWVIYASLRAVAIDKALWELLGGGDDCLLFRRDDFVEPEHSYSFAVLEHHPNEEIRALAKFLRWQCHNPVRDVPPLSEEIPTPPTFISDLTAVITKKRKAPQTFAQVQQSPPQQVAQAPVANKNLPEWIHTNSNVSAVVGARSRPKAPPSRVAQSSTWGPEPEFEQAVPRAVVSKGGINPIQKALVQYGAPVRTTKFEAYTNTDPFGNSRHMLFYEFMDPIGKSIIPVTRPISDAEFAQVKDLTEATVLCDAVDPALRNIVYELAAYKAVKPIIPTGIEPELKPTRRKAKFKDVRFVDPKLITFILAMPMVAAIAGLYAASTAAGHVALVAWMLLMYFFIWAKPMQHRKLVSRGIPARAIVYSIQYVSGDAKVEYGFMSVQGMIKTSVKCSESDLHGLSKGDVLTVLYDLHNPSNNLIYQLAVYAAV